MEPAYHKVSSEASSTALGEEDEGHHLYELEQQNLRSSQIRQSKRLLIANIVLFCISALLLARTYYLNTPSTGKEGYRIGLEVFHQLHCLNMLKKSTFPEVYGGEDDFAEDKGTVRKHLDHCLEMLRMNLMCQVDISVITFHDLPGKPGDPWPDFSTIHVCRDFDAVMKWAIDHTVANDDVF